MENSGKEIVNETKRYIYYKDHIYSKCCYKILKIYSTKKGTYSMTFKEGQKKQSMYYFYKK